MDEIIFEHIGDGFKLQIGLERNTKMAHLYLTDRLLRVKFRTPMLFTYNGRVWIKSSGGKAVTREKLSMVLPEAQSYVDGYFG